MSTPAAAPLITAKRRHFNFVKIEVSMPSVDACATGQAAKRLRTPLFQLKLEEDNG